MKSTNIARCTGCNAAPPLVGDDDGVPFCVACWANLAKAAATDLATMAEAKNAVVRECHEWKAKAEGKL